MLVQEAYLMTFELLNDFFCNSGKKDDFLASLLSDMDPKLFRDGQAADIATYNDWYECIKKYEKKGKIKNREMFMAILDFLSYYQKEFGFNFEQVIEYVEELKKNEGKCETFIEKCKKVI